MSAWPMLGSFARNAQKTGVPPIALGSSAVQASIEVRIAGAWIAFLFTVCSRGCSGWPTPWEAQSVPTAKEMSFNFPPGRSPGGRHNLRVPEARNNRQC